MEIPNPLGETPGCRALLLPLVEEMFAYMMGYLEPKASKRQPGGMETLLVLDYPIISLALSSSSHVYRPCGFQGPLGFCFLIYKMRG